MHSLGELAEEIGALFRERSRIFHRASLFVKLVLVVGGATLTAIAHTVELAHSNDEISAWTVVGLAAAALVAIGGIFVAVTEWDASIALEDARKAIDDARQRERDSEDFDLVRSSLSNEVRRGLQLYNSMDVMRGAIEQCLDIPGITPAHVIQTGLSAAINSLVVSFDFDIEDTWTICVYAAQKEAESGKATLRCVAQERKIACKITEARAWPEGVGVAGVSYSMGNEIIIPDMAAAELGTVFNLKTNARDYDEGRYRSMVAAPILVGGSNFPWGIAIVTSDRAHHFSTERSDGVPTAQPLRAIAAMAALAVKAVERCEPLHRPAVQMSEGTTSLTTGAPPAAANETTQPIEKDQGTR